MNRSSYRNFMILTLALMLAVSVFIFYRGQKEDELIEDRRNQLTKLKQELENAARLSAALTELDQLTINEQTATQLDILRHLGLEQTQINFKVDSREVRAVGDSTLYVRSVQADAVLPYPAALYLVDRLHNTRKIVITQLDVDQGREKGDKVRVRLKGKIYGLDKKVAAQ